MKILKLLIGALAALALSTSAMASDIWALIDYDGTHLSGQGIDTTTVQRVGNGKYYMCLEDTTLQPPFAIWIGVGGPTSAFSSNTVHDANNPSCFWAYTYQTRDGQVGTNSIVSVMVKPYQDPTTPAEPDPIPDGDLTKWETDFTLVMNNNGTSLEASNVIGNYDEASSYNKSLFSHTAFQFQFLQEMPNVDYVGESLTGGIKTFVYIDSTDTNRKNQATLLCLGDTPSNKATACTNARLKIVKTKNPLDELPLATPTGYNYTEVTITDGTPNSQLTVERFYGNMSDTTTTDPINLTSSHPYGYKINFINRMTSTNYVVTSLNPNVLIHATRERDSVVVSCYGKDRLNKVTHCAGTTVRIYEQ